MTNLQQMLEESPIADTYVLAGVLGAWSLSIRLLITSTCSPPVPERQDLNGRTSLSFVHAGHKFQ